MWMIEVLRQSWLILVDSAVYVLFGFAVAGVVHAVLARGFFVNALKRRGFRSVALATLIGGPLDLCSCSVLPAAIALRRRGVSRGATVAFLISTPELSFQAFMLTYALLGGWMAAIRPIAACITALVAGLLQNLLESRWGDEPENASADAPDSGTRAAPAGDAAGHGDRCPDHEHSHDDPLAEFEQAARRPTVRNGLRYAFVDIFDDVAGWMTLGFLVAGAIQVLLPQSVMLALLGNPWVALLVMAVIGVPMYVCAEASTPIAAAFMAKGVAPGAGLVFLLCGPATNFGSIVVLLKQLGRRAVVVYLASIVIVALCVGAIVNVVHLRFPLFKAESIQSRSDIIPLSIRIAAAVLFVALCAVSFLRQRYPLRGLALFNRMSPIALAPRPAGALLALLALAGYGLSGFAAVQPDEIGIIRRFGRVVDDRAAPGLHWVWPPPIGVMDRVPVDRVQRLMLGLLPQVGDAPPEVDEGAAWVWLGDECVVSTRYAVHYSARPDQPRQFAYGVSNVVELVRVASQAAIRRVLSTSTIDTIYTVGREPAEAAVRAQIQALCDQAACGVRVDGFRFLEVHAPTEVHAAFRDVASAIEDQHTFVLRAEGERSRTLPRARGDAVVRLADAQMRRTDMLARARGEADAFSRLVAAARPYRATTEARLYFETLERLLPRLKKFIRTDDTGRPLGVWINSPGESAPAEPQ